MTSGQGRPRLLPESSEQTTTSPFRKPIPEPRMKNQNLNLAVFSGPFVEEDSNLRPLDSQSSALPV